MITTVFLGPSLSLEEARAIVPDAVFRPPAAQGDLLAAADRDSCQVIGLIDGTFHQNLSVWHNEICYLLSRGIVIYGSSSMGALRAVETERFGMKGVGTIFGWYRDGIVTGDDEVALVHGDHTTGFPSLSLPMVNVRASVEAARANRSVDSTLAQTTLDVAKALHYPDRNVTNIVRGLQDSGCSENELVAIRQLLTSDYIDQKKLDAIALLREIAQLIKGAQPPPAVPPFTFARSSVFETLYNLDREIQVGQDNISQQRIAEYVALYSPDFENLRRSSLDRCLVAFFAAMLGLKVTLGDVDAERRCFCEEHRIESQEELARWLSCNGLNEKDFNEFLTQEASCRRLRFWSQNSRSFDRGCRALLDELRIRGTFQQWALQAVEAESLFAVYANEPEYTALQTEHPASLAEKHAESGHARILGDAGVFAEHRGFDGVSSLADALRRNAVVNDVRRRISTQVEALQHALDATDREVH